MLLLRGGLAATSFKLKQQLQSAQNISPQISSIESYWLYFVEHCGVLQSEQIGLLRSLLSVEQALSKNYKLLEEVIISPRIGTISPWSSKATDIINQCGLGKTGRIERGLLYRIGNWDELSVEDQTSVLALLHDRMTQTTFNDIDSLSEIFAQHDPKPLLRLENIDQLSLDISELNQSLGLALSEDEIDYLVVNYKTLGRCPTDVELMMFAQANSEHCRHKIFNADWTIDDQVMPHSLFGMIKATHDNTSHKVLSAYKDNAAVIHGHHGERFYPQQLDQTYGYHSEDIHILMKVETHNHPTAISPFPGASTGSGGEIRDEGATGRGGYPKAGLCGFSVSNLQIPGSLQPWEQDYGKPERIVSALDIMIEGPIGAAAFNNEFGRPNILGYFRTYEQSIGGLRRGYHKPIMLAGGLGNIRASDVEKKSIPAGTPIVVLGGPAMLIGLGGGAASSMASGSSDAQLDYASVQRDNPEMERRCQEVINRCWSMAENNPVLSIHDVGAGGLSNALPEILHDSGMGGKIELREIPNAEPGMSPLEIWCNEAQERYVLAINKSQLDEFKDICQRERCLFAIVGEATDEPELIVSDAYFNETPIQMPMDVLLGKPPKTERNSRKFVSETQQFDYSSLDLEDAINRVLQCPTVASKKFLITIGDRTVTGLVARDQMVGPWQVPVADVAVTTSGYQGYTGEAMAMGERTPLAAFCGKKSAKMAISEAITNLLAANWQNTHNVRLSANWMAAANFAQEDANLYDAVQATSELCLALDIAIPVGKDSLSMQTIWTDNDQQKQVVSPVSLVVSAFVPVEDVRETWTPEIKLDCGPSYLVLIDLGRKQNRMGGSSLVQVFDIVDSEVPDLDDSGDLINFIRFINELKNKINVLAYHDRSDGGLFVTLCEMLFTARCGCHIQLDSLGNNPIKSLLNEELGCVLQISHEEIDQIVLIAKDFGLGDCIHVLGEPTNNQKLVANFKGNLLISKPRYDLEQLWSSTSYLIQSLRDNPKSADQEYNLIANERHTGLQQKLTFSLDEIHNNSFNISKLKPKVAVLREQGVNGHIEMAAAFHTAGFESIDVHMTDLMHDRIDLNDFSMLVACGGFSYGDVLGAGSGWAANILFNSKLKDIFQVFYNRENTLGLGVCNGCQMMSQLSSIIPGSQNWPRFVRNESEQFEARLVNVEVLASPSKLFEGMSGSIIPIAVAHGEGRVTASDDKISRLKDAQLVSLKYVDSSGNSTVQYPLNPNGSVDGITSVTNEDGRFTIMMPHPERLFRTVQHSWHPPNQGEIAPWLKLFANARKAFD